MVDNSKFQYFPVAGIENQELAIDPSTLNKEVAATAVVIGGRSEIKIEAMDLRKIEQLLFLHPVIPRGIEIKANRMVARGFSVLGDHTESVEYMQNIFTESGDITFVKRWVEDGYGFGTGFVELVPNKEGTEVLKLSPIHPVYFSFDKERKQPLNRVDIDAGDKLYVILDERTQEPVGYRQYQYISGRIEPTGERIALDKVAHLAFDLWGDEVEGISVIRYIINILNYVLNIESAAAEAGYRTANPRYKFTTTIRERADLEKFAAQVANINDRDSIIMTEGNDVDIINPGLTNFVDYHDRFISLLAVKLGIPKPLILLDGTSTNKATLREQTDFLRDDNMADEFKLEQTINAQIIEPACKMKFGADFKDFPKFKLNDSIDSEDAIIDRLKEKSLAILNLTNSALQLLKNGLTEEAKNVFALIPKDQVYDIKEALKEFDEVEIEDRATKVSNQVDVGKTPPATNQNPIAENINVLPTE